MKDRLEGGPGPDQVVSWRAYKQLDARQAAAYNTGRYSHAGQLTHAEQRAYTNALWSAAKKDRGWGNRNLADGVRVSTSSGLRVKIRGESR